MTLEAHKGKSSTHDVLLFSLEMAINRLQFIFFIHNLLKESNNFNKLKK